MGYPGTTGRKSSASSGGRDTTVPTLQVAEQRCFRGVGMSSYAHRNQAITSAELY